MTEHHKVSGDGVRIFWSHNGEYAAIVEVQELYEKLPKDWYALFFAFLKGSWQCPVAQLREDDYNTWTILKDASRTVILNAYFPSFPAQLDEMKKAHAYLVDVRQALIAPNAEQAMDLMSRADETVRDYALSQMSEWQKEWGPGLKTLARLSGNGKGTIKDPATGRVLTVEEAKQFLVDAEKNSTLPDGKSVVPGRGPHAD